MSGECNRTDARRTCPRLPTETPCEPEQSTERTSASVVFGLNASGGVWVEEGLGKGQCVALRCALKKEGGGTDAQTQSSSFRTTQRSIVILDER